jgi:hypothetical protein
VLWILLIVALCPLVSLAAEKLVARIPVETARRPTHR